MESAPVAQPQPNDLSRSLAPLEQDATLCAVIELSLSSWLAAGIVPGIARQPLKKLEPDEGALLRLLQRWREEAIKAGRSITRIAVAFEAGRDGFWLARWLQVRGIEVHVIHSTSVAVSREHRRAKTDRLDTAMLMRVFLGWLERMAASWSGSDADPTEYKVAARCFASMAGFPRIVRTAALERLTQKKVGNGTKKTRQKTPHTRLL